MRLARLQHRRIDRQARRSARLAPSGGGRRADARDRAGKTAAAGPSPRRQGRSSSSRRPRTRRRRTLRRAHRRGRSGRHRPDARPAPTAPARDSHRRRPPASTAARRSTCCASDRNRPSAATAACQVEARPRRAHHQHDVAPRANFDNSRAMPAWPLTCFGRRYQLRHAVVGEHLAAAVVLAEIFFAAIACPVSATLHEREGMKLRRSSAHLDRLDADVEAALPPAMHERGERGRRASRPRRGAASAPARRRRDRCHAPSAMRPARRGRA